jgi:hypothetical protein
VTVAPLAPHQPIAHQRIASVNTAGEGEIAKVVMLPIPVAPEFDTKSDFRPFFVIVSQ